MVRQRCTNFKSSRNYLGHGELGIILSSFTLINNEVHKSSSIHFSMQWHSGKCYAGLSVMQMQAGTLWQVKTAMWRLASKQQTKKTKRVHQLDSFFLSYFFCVYIKKKTNKQNNKPSHKAMHTETRASIYGSPFMLETSFSSFHTLWAWWIFLIPP